MLIMDVPHIDPSHCSKINWLPVSDRVECCIANIVFKCWNGIVPGYIHEMFKSLYSADIAQDLCRCHWAHLCGKQIQGKKEYPSSGQNYSPK